MQFKLRPEDFVVEELSARAASEEGPLGLYLLRKRRLSTFEALRRLARAQGLPLDRLSVAGLKDAQGVTSQRLAARGELDLRRCPDGVELELLGRTDRPLEAGDLRGNRFTVTVRGLSPSDLERSRRRLRQIAAHGLVNYFDDQRFGTLVAGQPMPGRSLAHGRFEEAVRALLAAPGHLDSPDERRFKRLVQRRWGEWDFLARRWGGRRGAGIVRHLRRRPGDFRGALRACPARERALHVFAYQSLVWNRAVAHYLTLALPAERVEWTPYAGGAHVWPDLDPDAPAPDWPQTFPLLDHKVCFADELVRAANEQVLADEGLSLERFRIRGVRGCFFRRYERSLFVRPVAFELLREQADAARPGRRVVVLRFELPPGAYATLLLKRLFRTARRGLPRAEARA
ncbi:MAG: tRNA pseudouridine(13) synthase TruD [Planctomycetota bacterium]|nr:MAG: tRNA pseudouridine(13) synthase TruD [Planctomycetota bacterium]